MRPLFDMPFNQLLKGALVHRPFPEGGNQRDKGSLEHFVNSASDIKNNTGTLTPSDPRRKKSRFWPLALACFCLILALATPARADLTPHWQEIAAKTAEQDWNRVAALGERSQHPVIRKLALWLYITKSPLPVGFATLSRFMLETPGWPVPMSVIEESESKMPSDLPPDTVIGWFDKHPPRTARGLDVYLRALQKRGYNDQMQRVLETRWEKIRLSAKDLKVFLRDHKGLLTGADHYNRADYLIWNERFGEVEDIIPYLDGDLRLLAEARLALARNKPGATAALNRVQKELLNDSGLLYERLRWRRRHNLDTQAAELLARQPAHLSNPAKWWQERHILARRALEKGDHKLAYDIASAHKLREGFEFSQAEWLLGWLDLRYLNRPEHALQHFTALYDKVKFPVSKSRAAYWLGRTYEALQRPEEARNWYQKAATFPTTFYGQLAAEKAGTAAAEIALAAASGDKTAESRFKSDPRVEAILLLANAHLREETRPLFDALLAEADQPRQFELIAKLAVKVKMNQYAVQAGKTLSQNFGIAQMDEGYPVIQLPSRVTLEPELTHAIIRQESLFDAKAESPAGARGLMQLMPATAKSVARQLKMPFSADRLLSDPGYNATLGSAYLQGLLDDYNGSYVLAIASYNAGPMNTGEWIDLFGDPRAPAVDIVDWIEMIPFYETRNYVQRVLENRYIYQKRLGKEPRIVLK